jgi:hypothetical protein
MPLFAATGCRGAEPETTGADGAVVCARANDAGARSAKSANTPARPEFPKREILACWRMKFSLARRPFFCRPQLHIFGVPAQAGYGDKRSSQ